MFLSIPISAQKMRTTLIFSYQIPPPAMVIEQIAICPKCGIYSVIGDVSGFPIEPTFLSVMRDFWFSPSEISKTMGATAT